jgi:rhomboid protease GluP
VAFLLLLAVVGVLTYRMTTPEDRKRYLGIALAFAQRLKTEVTEPGPEQELRDALRARMPYALVTLALVAVSVIVFVGMLAGARAIGDPDTLVAWGASTGIRTTNGEWWRLVTSTFVHPGVLHLLVNAAILFQVGTLLERLVGRLALAGAYLSSAAFAGLVHVSSYPLAVNAGSSAAIFGLYGFLVASAIWPLFQRRDEEPPPEAEEETEDVPVKATIPLLGMKRLGAGAAVFIVYSVLGGYVHAAELVGLVTGAIYALVLGPGGGAPQSKTIRIAVATIAAAAIAVACAMPLRNIANVKPEIVRVLATEERTAAAYQAASDAFKKGRLSAEALAQLAERTIVPELQAVDARLTGLANVPAEQQPLVADARDYLRLRSASWRARAEAIRKTNLDSRGAAKPAAADASSRLQAEARYRSHIAVTAKAETAERLALEAFQRIKSAPL